MKRLILMRHAKSDWSTAASSDHARPLNARGRMAATAMGDWLRAQSLDPDEVLCSSAARTVETCDRLALPETAQVKQDKLLYLAGADVMLKILQRASGDQVLMIGHNPGVGAMAEGLMIDLPTHPQFLAYPTCATLVADFDIDNWRDAAWGKAIARHFVVPRDL